MEAVRAYLGHLKPEGVAAYLHQQLPLDTAFPLAYGSFGALAVWAAFPRRWRMLCVVWLVAMAFDLLENGAIVRILSTDASALGQDQIDAFLHCHDLKWAALAVATPLLILALVLIVRRRMA